MFAHSEEATSEAVAASECGLPRWAKLSPNVPDVTAIAGAALAAGAEGLTLTNTLLGLALDVEHGPPGARRRWRRPLGGGAPSRGGARRVGVPGGVPGHGHHRCRGRGLGSGRRGVPQGRSRRRAGRNGDVPRPARAVEGAPPAQAVVRGEGYDGRRAPCNRPVTAQRMATATG